ncbi:hypothetical protein MRX96_029643 [Rhipicephalus microplus]
MKSSRFLCCPDFVAQQARPKRWTSASIRSRFPTTDPLQVTRSDHDVKELLNNEEHQLLMQLKELPCENYTHHHVLDMEASNVAAAQGRCRDQSRLCHPPGSRHREWTGQK